MGDHGGKGCTRDVALGGDDLFPLCVLGDQMVINELM